MPLTGRKVLITEDEPDEQHFIATILEDAGAEVITAHNGTAAGELVEIHRPDLMTVDINMPGTDVIRMLSSLTTLSDPPRICIVSGRPELRQVIVDKFSAAGLGFVDKPFTHESLLAELNRLLDS